MSHPCRIIHTCPLPALFWHLDGQPSRISVKDIIKGKPSRISVKGIREGHPLMTPVKDIRLDIRRGHPSMKSVEEKYAKDIRQGKPSN